MELEQFSISRINYINKIMTNKLKFLILNTKVKLLLQMIYCWLLEEKDAEVVMNSNLLTEIMGQTPTPLLL